MIMRRTLLVAFAVAAAAAKQPHILMIVADDYGYNDVGYHQNAPSPANPAGHPTTSAAAGIMATPTIDRLASEGVKLGSYYVQPLCSPTRSTMMTGRYPHHTGIGPDVIEIDHPYGVPKAEVFLPEVLKAEGYATYAVGKWHLGACHEGYLPTERGFDTFAGYLAGAQSYYNHAGDFRNGTNASELGAASACVGNTLDGHYSAQLYAGEVARLIAKHAAEGRASSANRGSNGGDANSSPSHSNGNGNNTMQPSFVYMAMQNVHNPYDLPPFDVNATYPQIKDYQRRIYAGMVSELDDAVANVTAAYKKAGIWDETVVVFTTDNGGIGPGSNYPLRGAKVMMWEGGIRGVGFVRGTNDVSIAPVPKGTTSHELMHSTDWLPTLRRLAGYVDQADVGEERVGGGGSGGEPRRKDGFHRVPLPLDGVDQWDVIAAGGASKTTRESIMHCIVSDRARPVRVPANSGAGANRGESWSTGSCLDSVDPSIKGGCHAFGIIGGAIRVGNLKLLLSGTNGSATAGLESNVPAGVRQYTPTGFTPTTNNTVPLPVAGVYLFNIANDPTESHNLAADPAYAASLADMLARYNTEAASPATVINLGWRFGFPDPQRSQHPGGGTCQGPFVDSSFCPYGIEDQCFVRGSGFAGGDVGAVKVTASAVACQAMCANASGGECAWFVWRAGGAGGADEAEGASTIMAPTTVYEQGYAYTADAVLLGGNAPSSVQGECHMKKSLDRAQQWDCEGCVYGPGVCPH